MLKKAGRYVQSFRVKVINDMIHWKPNVIEHMMQLADAHRYAEE